MYSVYLIKNTTPKYELEELISSVFELKLISRNEHFSVGINVKEELLVNINNFRLDFITDKLNNLELNFLRKNIEILLKKNLIRCQSIRIETSNQNSEKYNVVLT